MSTHAEIINSQYDHSESHFVNLRERLAESMVGANELALTAMVSEFKRRFKQWTKFVDMQICKAIMVPMDKILIDTTMQRSVNFTHILNILNNFAETMVMAIQVYEDPEKPGHYIAWDGQHTAIVLYIIATKVFGERIAGLMVPVVVYSVKQKAEIRRNFILLNGEAKSMLEFIDLWKQMVYGVKVDGADDPVWMQASEKQDQLARAGLFATHKKFMDDRMPGAFTLLADTLCSKSADNLKPVDVTRMFCDYWIAMKALTSKDRPVDAKEARQLYEYFNQCHAQGIKVDDAYIIEFTQFANDYFECDWSASGAFWEKCQMAYNNWYAKNNPDDLDDDGEQRIRGFQKEFSCGGPFLVAQLKKSTKLKVPTLDSSFVTAKKDLW
jgi:hypothetical protein